MQKYDVVIIGGSFAGLSLAHHLPKNLSVLVVEAKPRPEASVESTGLITTKTRDEFSSFFDIDKYITNPITTIAVIAPDYDQLFFSSTPSPWIHQTDTKALVKALADTLPSNVTLQTGMALSEIVKTSDVTIAKLVGGGTKNDVIAGFVVGADGCQSRVASSVPRLGRNERFLFGYEQVFFGNVHFGPNPAETIYHFWFGEFSLGYGGWLSPTVIDGKPAFRLGLAKLMADRADARELTAKFAKKLAEKKFITIDGDADKPNFVFGSLIPIGGAVKDILHDNILLIGNAAGYCGAFAADGIKGAIISAKEAAPLIADYLAGDKEALQKFQKNLNRHGWLLDYYRRQLFYRWVWDRMKSDRTFTALYNIIEKEKETFLEQFCDSKDQRRHLSSTVLKFKHLPALLKFSWFLFLDLFI